MLQDTYVNFETAKLLKEKGFDGECYKVWEKHDGAEPTLVAAPVFVEGETVVTRESVDAAAQYMTNIYSLDNKVDGYLAPTQDLARQWLRKEHKIFIRIIEDVLGDLFELEVYKDGYCWKKNTIEDSYEKAVDTALYYTLTNLL